MAYIYDLADVWNAAGTTFTAIKMNVVDTASAAGSLLMDLQVGGSTKFKVDKAGTTTFSGNLQISNNGVYIEGAGVGTVRIPGIGGYYGWTTNTASTPASTIDLILARDAANTLAQRNSTAAQAFNLYNTYTDASNYERGYKRWVGNVLQIGVEAAGTGSTTRAMRIDMGVSGTLLTRYLNNTNNSLTMFDFIADATGTATYALGGSAPLLRFGGTTSSFPALKRSTTVMQSRLADDSAFAGIQGKLTTDTAYTAGAPTATGYIVLFDSTGTAYRVPAVAN